MRIKPVEMSDRTFWMSIDTHVSEEGFQGRVYTKAGYVLWEKETRIGLMWHCVLWDNLPFLNLLFILPAYRGKGYGAGAMAQWEQEMKKRGFKTLLISTQVDESAQFFYRKLGYVDCGGLVFQGTPNSQPMEMFMRKVLE